MRSPWAAFWLLALCTGCEVSFHDEPALEPETAPDPEPSVRVGDSHARGAAREPEADPTPEPNPPPPLHSFTQRWQVPFSAWGTRGAAVAPWGDVAVLTRDELRLYGRESGQLLAESPLLGLGVLSDAFAFQPDGSLVLVSDEGIERVSFPSRTWERLVEVAGARAARVQGAHVAVLQGPRHVAVYALPATEPVHAFEAAHEVEHLALSPDGGAVALGCGKQGVFVRDLASGVERRLSLEGGKGPLGFGVGRLFACTRQWQLVPWDLASDREHPSGYALGVFLAQGSLYELPDGRVLCGNTVYPAEPAAVGATSYDSGTEGLALPLERPDVVAPRPDGRAVCGLSHWKLGYASVDLADPERPFALAELVGDPPPPPGREAGERISASARAAARAKARAEFREGLGALEVSAFVPGKHSFLPPDELPTSPNTAFVRLTGAGIGGNFDSWGDEEVVFQIAANGATRTLDFVKLGLSNEKVKVYEPEHAPWIELPEAAELRIDLDVFDADLTGREHMTSIKQPLTLRAADFKPEPTARTLELRPIIDLDDVWISIEFVAAPRRDARDAASVAAVRSAFGPLLALEPA
ncbi:MAG: hypothetical protein KDD82_13660, partial [Planctomycetes bacterium]|nr:hypothetical protein [Planctomycetota bacterium]